MGSTQLEVRRSNLKELGDFLRAKRKSIFPEHNGIVTTRRRLVPGLSRDETATLADIGASWYARLEAGRVPQPTLATIRAVSRALQLNLAESTYVLKLAGLLPPIAVADTEDDGALPPLAELFRDGDLVAFSLWNRFLAPVGWNAVADGMYGFSAYPDAVSRNPLVHLADERIIAFFGDAFESWARNVVGMFRRAYSAGEPTPYAHKVYAIASEIPIFAKFWREHVVADRSNDPSLPFVRHHWKVGTFSATSTDFKLDDEGLLLRIVAPADEESRAKFQQLRPLGRSSGTLTSASANGAEPELAASSIG